MEEGAVSLSSQGQRLGRIAMAHSKIWSIDRASLYGYPVASIPSLSKEAVGS